MPYVRITWITSITAVSPVQEGLTGSCSLDRTSVNRTPLQETVKEPVWLLATGNLFFCQSLLTLFINILPLNAYEIILLVT